MLNVITVCIARLVLIDRHSFTCRRIPAGDRIVLDEMIANTEIAFDKARVSPVAAVYPPHSSCRDCFGRTDRRAYRTGLLDIRAADDRRLVKDNRYVFLCRRVPAADRTVPDKVVSDCQSANNCAAVLPGAAVYPPLRI